MSDLGALAIVVAILSSGLGIGGRIGQHNSDCYWATGLFVVAITLGIIAVYS